MAFRTVYNLSFIDYYGDADSSGVGASMIRTIKKHGNLFPEALNVLAAVKDGMFPVYHREHDLRHPYSLYVLSCEKVVTAFGTLTEEHERAMASAENWDSKPFLKAQKELIEAISGHVDDCYAVLKGLNPPSSVPVASHFIEDWLTKAGHPTVGNFKSAISPHLEKRISPVWNRIKHGNQQLRDLVMVAEPENIRVVGYWLEGVQNGAVGPDPAVHPGRTAFSCNLDMKLHLWYFYSVGSALANAIAGAVSGLKPTPFTHESEGLIRILERVSALPMHFFPDEQGLRSAPKIEFKPGHSLIAEKVKAKPPVFKTMKVTARPQFDLVERGVYMPYFQPQRPSPFLLAKSSIWVPGRR